MAIDKKSAKDSVMSNGSYSVVPNELYTARVSNEAKTIWGYLMSMPEDWDSGRNNLARNLNMHRKTISSRIQELIAAKMIEAKVNQTGSYDFSLLPPHFWQPPDTCAEMPRGMTCPGAGASGTPKLGHDVPHIKEAISNKSSRSKKKGALPVFEEFADYLANVSQELQQNWLKLYGEPDAIKFEIQKAINWELSKPKNTKKNKGSFLNGWLSRSDLKPPESKKDKLVFNVPHRSKSAV
jgi:hypothetical protein